MQTSIKIQVYSSAFKIIEDLVITGEGWSSYKRNGGTIFFDTIEHPAEAGSTQQQ